LTLISHDRIILTIFITKLSNLLVFNRLRHKLNFEMAKIINFAFVHSHLIYGIEMPEFTVVDSRARTCLPRYQGRTFTGAHKQFGQMPFLDCSTHLIPVDAHGGQQESGGGQRDDLTVDD